MGWMKRGVFLCLLLLSCLAFLLGGEQAEAASLSGSWQYETEEGWGWEPYTVGSRPLEETDRRVLWLRTTVIPDYPEKNVLLFTTTMKSIRIWIDGELIYNYGNFGQSRFGDGARWHMVKLPKLDHPAEMRIQILADTPQHLGLFREPVLDTGRAQVEKLFLYDVPYMLALPIAIIVFWMMLVLYWFNSDQKMKPLYLSVSVFMLIFSLWMVAASNVKSFILDAPVFWWDLLSVTAYLLPLSANSILWCVLRDEPNTHMELIVGANAMLFITAFCMECMGMFGLNRMMTGFYILLAIGESVSIWWLLQASKHRNLLSCAVLPGTVAFTVLGVCDGLSGHFNLLPWRTYVTPLAIYAFLYFVAGVLKQQLIHEAKLTKRAEGLKQEVEEAVEQSERDALTGCYNRTMMRNMFLKAEKQSIKRGRPFSVIMMDIDHFKQVNDTHGHDAGDAVLAGFSSILRKGLSEGTVLIRWGGEEFLALLPGQDIVSAAATANILRRKVMNAHPGGLSITCSMGVSTWHDSAQGEKTRTNEKDTEDALFKRADRALYYAKQTGRNRVCLEDEAPEENEGD